MEKVKFIEELKKIDENFCALNSNALLIARITMINDTDDSIWKSVLQLSEMIGGDEKQLAYFFAGATFGAKIVYEGRKPWEVAKDFFYSLYIFVTKKPYKWRHKGQIYIG